MAVDLVLGARGAYTPPAGSAVALVLGDTEGTSGVLTDATVAVTLRIGVSLAISKAQAIAVRSGAAVWTPATGLQSAGPRMPWSAASGAVARGAGLPWARLNAGPRAAAALPWGASAIALAIAARNLAWARSAATARTAQAGWSAGQSASFKSAAPWSAGGARAAAAAARWQAAAARSSAAAAPWAAASGRQARAAVVWQASVSAAGRIAALWRAALTVPEWPHAIPAGDGVYGFTAPGGPVALVFCTLAADSSLDLVFGAETCITPARIGDGFSIASRHSYMHTHSLSAIRVSDGAALPVYTIDLSADDQSFGWTVSASGPPELLGLLTSTDGAPVRIRVLIDGMSWDAVVLGIGRTREHGRTSVTVTARSASALLADPYMAEVAFLNAAPLTAQQIGAAALASTGIALDWQATDWLVPAGAWSFYGTPMAAIRRIADSIGAVVASPRTGDTITIRPRYPVLPWAWSASSPDATLPIDVLVSEGYERADRPPYNGIYVSGQAQGVLALVKRSGTDGALLQPMVTDALVTALDAARQRGSSVLGQGGPQANMTLTLPVLTGPGEPGVIDPGKLVAVTDPAGNWRGLTRSVRVSASYPSVRQTIVLERHV